MRTVDDAPVGFGIDICVGLTGGVAVVFVRVWDIGYWQWDIGEVMERTKVVAKVVVGCATKLEIYRFGDVFGRKYTAEEMVAELLAVHAVGLVVRR